MRLVRVRPCDGACCEEAPRWPNADRTDCVFHDEHGCKLMRGEADVPETNTIFVEKTGWQVFQETCLDWPHNTEKPRLGKTGGCCWQWIED